jgi:PKD repeat protein
MLVRIVSNDGFLLAISSLEYDFVSKEFPGYRSTESTSRSFVLEVSRNSLKKSSELLTKYFLNAESKLKTTNEGDYMNPNQKMSLVLISIILLSATALAAPATDHTKAKAIKAPLAAFSASPTSGNAQLEVQFTDESTGTPTSWKWSFGDGKYSTAENPVHTYSKAGKYTVS